MKSVWGKFFLTSLLFTLINVCIEWFLDDYLLAATLVVEWTFFVLLAQRILAIPLPRASMTLFCYFSLLMGATMVEMHFSPKELTEEEKLLVEGFEEAEKEEEKPGEDWVLRVEKGLLANKTYASKYWVMDFIYREDAPLHPEKTAAVPTPKPPSALPDPAVTSVAPPSSGMTGEEFEALFFPGAPVPEIRPEDPAMFTGPDPLPTAGYADPPLPSSHGGISITGEEMSTIVEIKNRSTDPGYLAPEYDVSAVGIGRGGRFAIVDGDLLKEGSVLYTQHTQPRGWRLYKVESTQVFWQPLK